MRCSRPTINSCQSAASGHFRDCKALLILSLTHISSDKTSTWTFTFLRLRLIGGRIKINVSGADAACVPWVRLNPALSRRRPRSFTSNLLLYTETSTMVISSVTRDLGNRLSLLRLYSCFHGSLDPADRPAVDSRAINRPVVTDFSVIKFVQHTGTAATF